MKNDNLRDQMLELEPYPEDLKMNIRKEIEHINERPMKPWERPATVLFCVILVAAGIWKVTRAALYGDIGNDPLHYFVVLPALMVLLGWGLAMYLKNLKRGSTRPRNEYLLVYTVVVGVLVITVKNILMRGEFGLKDLAAFVVAGLVGIYVRNESNTQSLRENVLRNELALVELTELVAGRDEHDGDSD